MLVPEPSYTHSFFTKAREVTAELIHSKRVTSTELTEWVLLLCDHRQLGRHFSIQFCKGLPIFGKIIFVENCLNRTLWNTRLTVNAFIWMNVNHLVTFIKAFDRANNNTVCVLTGEAGFGNDMRHIRFTPYQKNVLPTNMLLNISVFESAKKSVSTEWANPIDIDSLLDCGILGSTEPPVNESSIGHTAFRTSRRVCWGVEFVSSAHTRLGCW